MMKRLWILTGCLVFLSSCSAQKNEETAQADVVADGQIRWLGFEEAVALHASAPKKILIDVYTDWCGWCKRMDKTTFVDPRVVREINTHFYAVKLDAERKDTVRFRDQVFVFKPEYKSHELALALLNGKMSYPSYVFLDEQFAMISPVPGYKKPEEMLPLLAYFAGDIYKTRTWEEYMAEPAPASE